MVAESDPAADGIQAEQDALGRSVVPLLERVMAGETVPIAEFRAASDEHFDRFSHPDAYFSLFAGSALDAILGATQTGGRAVLLHAIAFALAWESRHPGQRLHKGTAYYFAAMIDILLG